MKRAKRGIALAIGTLVLLALASASSWEGSAMTGTVGDFPSSGYYAACNSFARNTTIDVTNLDNGRTVTVIVTRGLESSGVFMMLSAEAATALGIQPGRLARIRAAEPRSAVELAPAAKTGSAFDPDLNPRLLAAEELKKLGYELAPQSPPAATATQPAAVAAAPEKAVAAPVVAPVQPVPTKPVEPAPVGKESPESLASAKPRPVRTIVLPQLPEPPEPATAVAAVEPAAGAQVPEVSTEAMPVPDETPIRVATHDSPRRYEAPALMPDVADRGPQAPVPTSIALSLVDPEPVDATPKAESALAYSRSAPPLSGGEADASLADPAIPSTEHADAFSRTVPALATTDARTELAWPELEADEMPEVVLSHLSEPALSVPATSLAEGELVLPADQRPSAVALETPAYGAAVTSVELADAEPKSDGKPVAVGTGPVTPADSAGSTTLADAAEHKPETAPMAASPEPKPAPAVALESPRDYIVSIEPSAPKPPAATPAPAAPAAAPAARTAAPVAAPSAAPAKSGAVIVTVPLEKGLYYIQIGAYASEAAARDASSRLGSKFTILVQKMTEKGKDTWRVFVGPLSRDESGVALVKVRSMGFKDAFVKSGG